ncbi:MAG: GGDEF domain-containing protein [Chloracidobacterium sp.]|nr:GGDEF domain-containing protein [Chloracidobacterium sp.]
MDRGYVVYDQADQPIRLLGSMMDVTERKSLEEQLTHLALHDPLTKIANRVLFRDRVDHALSKVVRNHVSIAVLFSISIILSRSMIRSATRRVTNFLSQLLTVSRIASAIRTPPPVLVATNLPS